MAVHPLDVLSLCTGCGGIELGLRVAGVEARTVCYVEREAAAAGLLVEAMGEGRMDPAPIWSDLTTFDGAGWRGVVDIVTAGFPCQPISCAGQRLGTDDERWIWPSIARIIRDVEPSVVFLENVPPIISSGLIAVVLGSLAELGYHAEWDLFSAADVGASHKRERWFCLAYRDRGGLARIWQQMRGQGLDGSPRHEPVGCGGVGDDVADAGCVRQGRGESLALAGCGDRALPSGSGSSVVHAQGSRLEIGPTGGAAAHARPERAGMPLSPPGPGDADAWRAILDVRPDLAPAVPSQPSLRRVDDGPARGVGDWLPRHDQLRLLGNGVVPLTAALAWRVLAGRVVNP